MCQSRPKCVKIVKDASKSSNMLQCHKKCATVIKNMPKSSNMRQSIKTCEKVMKHVSKCFQNVSKSLKYVFMSCSHLSCPTASSHVVITVPYIYIFIYIHVSTWEYIAIYAADLDVITIEHRYQLYSFDLFSPRDHHKDHGPCLPINFAPHPIQIRWTWTRF
jgi:hypothetical protein